MTVLSRLKPFQQAYDVRRTLYGRCYDVKMLKRRPYNVVLNVIDYGSILPNLKAHKQTNMLTRLPINRALIFANTNTTIANFRVATSVGDMLIM